MNSSSFALENFDRTQCMTYNVYHEARNQSMLGQMAVVFVTLNRVYDERFPNTICEVVSQGGHIRRHKCQFSWYCDGISDIPLEKKHYNTIRRLVIYMLEHHNLLVDVTDGALFYHSTKVQPKWSQKFYRTTKIGDHIFYRVKKYGTRNTQYEEILDDHRRIGFKQSN